MRVLFLTPYFVPDYAAGSMAYAAMAEDLARMGYQVTVLTGMPYYGREKIWEEYAGKFFVREDRGGYRVLRVYTYAAPRTNVPGRLFSWCLYNLLATGVALGLQRHDVLFAMNPFTMAGLPLHLLHWLRGARVIYSVEDIYPDALIRAGVLKRKLEIGLVDALERSCYRRASRIRVISEGMRESLISRGIPPARVVTLPYFADTDFVRPRQRTTALRSLHGLGDKFVVLYAGNMGLIHGVDVVIKAAALLQNDPEILFMLVGEGMEKPCLEQLARQLHLSNVRFLPMQPIEDLPDVLATADVSLVTLKKEFATESVPSKVYWILASGRPMVASASGATEIARLVEQSQAGICVDPAMPETLAEAILKLRANPAQRESMGKRGREFVVEHFSREAVARQLDALIRNVASNGHTR